MRWAFSFPRDNAGSSRAARIEIMAMTTNNSISVKANPIRFLNPNMVIAQCINYWAVCNTWMLDATERSFDKTPTQTGTGGK